MAIQGEHQVVVPTQKRLEKTLCMKGGKGEGSYAKNSQAQARHARSMLHLLKGALDTIQLLGGDGLFAVADLGCSCGENTLFIMDVIIKHLSKRFEDARLEVPEFQAFFSDLPSNDFNTLFQLLPPLEVKESLEECLAADNCRSYYAAGVPGSFYRRLFPSKSINVVHSAFSLHWLSEVPESVTDEKSAAYNGGKVFIHRASEHTANAYRQQFQQDLATFLRLRSLELKSGGSMFLVCLGRTSAEPTDQGGPGILFGSHFQDAWNDLVQEGLINANKRDKFNIPVYAASLQEFKEVVEASGLFTIKRLEIFKGGSPLVVDCPDDAASVGRALVNSARAVCGVLVDAHLGEALGNELFARLERRATSHARELMEHLQFNHIVASLALI